jgi:hypothetical protein
LASFCGNFPSTGHLRVVLRESSRHCCHVCAPCRWRDELWSGSCLVHKPVDILMLDTTYAIPRYTFPPQEQAIQMMVQVGHSGSCRQSLTALPL